MLLFWLLGAISVVGIIIVVIIQSGRDIDYWTKRKERRRLKSIKEKTWRKE